MKKIFISLLLIFSYFISFCQKENDSLDFNFGFESISKNSTLPNNWIKWGDGYNLKIDTIEKHSGKNSILIEPATKKTKNSFGCIAYPIPAEYEGNEIEVKAYFKLNNVTDKPIGLLLRIDGNSGILEFDNMQKRNIQGTSDWTLYSVKLPYPENAKTIYLGALLSGTGQLWVDDFQLLIDGIDIKNVKTKNIFEFKADTDKEFDSSSTISNINLNESKISDLYILGEIWGFLKYYHPSIAKGDYNWDYELFRILPKILECKNQTERNDLLSVWIDNLGAVEKGKLEKNKEKNIKIKPDLLWINSSALGDKLTLQLTNIKNAKRTKNNYYIDIAGVGSGIFKNENPYLSMKYPDTGFRLLCLYRYWNIIQYYFPYKNLIEENWNNVLKEFIPKFVNAENELEYKKTVLSLIARIHDSHANIWGNDKTLNNYIGTNYAPIKITFVENKAVVTDYYNDSLGTKSSLKIGDIIETINNISVKDIVKDKLPYTPASNYPTQLRNIAPNLLRTNDTILNIICKRKDSTFSFIIVKN